MRRKKTGIPSYILPGGRSRWFAILHAPSPTLEDLADLQEGLAKECRSIGGFYRHHMNISKSLRKMATEVKKLASGGGSLMLCEALPKALKAQISVEVKGIARKLERRLCQRR
jgi:hypothetical protein